MNSKSKALYSAKKSDIAKKMGNRSDDFKKWKKSKANDWKHQDEHTQKMMYGIGKGHLR